MVRQGGRRKRSREKVDLAVEIVCPLDIADSESAFRAEVCQDSGGSSPGLEIRPDCHWDRHWGMSWLGLAPEGQVVMVWPHRESASREMIRHGHECTMNNRLKLQISMDDQSLRVMSHGECLRKFTISTAEKGMGFEEGSNCTPVGKFRVYSKIGADEPEGTIFKGRKPVGLWDGRSRNGDLILSRILQLDGLDPENRNTLERYIYIHGTNREDQLGQPSSHGCVRMANKAVVELFDMVEVGTEVDIQPMTRGCQKLMFIDCDSTLSTIEGIDELGRARGEDVFEKVVELTNSAMNGDIAISEVFPRRMEMIRPDRKLCDEIAARYIDGIVSGVEALIAEARERGWLPVILSGGFAPLIEPLARHLGVDHIEAVPIYFDDEGNYADYGRDYPTTRNFGKNEVIRKWKKALLPKQVVMIGDGVSDLETQTDVDLFIGFGGVVEREKVQQGCDYWLADMTERQGLWEALESR